MDKITNLFKLATSRKTQFCLMIIYIVFQRNSGNPPQVYCFTIIYYFSISLER